MSGGLTRELDLVPRPGTELDVLPATPEPLLDRIRELEQLLNCCETPQVATEHVIHGGMYARTVTIPPLHILTGTLIKRATLVILCGAGFVMVGDEWQKFSGYQVLPASAGRKQVFVSRSELRLTMVFPSQAKSVDEAEAEFTDDADALLSRKQNANTVVITGQ